MRSPAGDLVGSIELNPADLATVSGSVAFDPPIPVVGMHICSWWNPANLLDVQLLGDPAACAP